MLPPGSVPRLYLHDSLFDVYVPPNKHQIVSRVDKALERCLEGTYIFLMGYLNARIWRPLDQSDEELATIIASYSLTRHNTSYLGVATTKRRDEHGGCGRRGDA